MEILLINPSDPRQEFHEAKPPLGLAYLAASLRAASHEIKIIDMPGFKVTIKDILQVIVQFKPKLIGISIVTPYLECSENIAKEIKNKYNIPILVGGPHPSALPEETLSCHYFDIVAYGEADETIVELVDAIKKKKNLKNIKGIAFRDEHGIYKTTPRRLIENLDKLPFPAWDLFDVKNYYSGSKKRVGVRESGFSIMTSRGCPGICKFCDTHNIWRHRYRSISPENVIKEILELYYKHNVKYLFFYDDTFTVNKKTLIKNMSINY